MHQESPEAPQGSPLFSDSDRVAVCALYLPRVRAYLSTHGLRREDLDDAQQEVFFRLLAALRTQTIDPNRVGAWLFAVARRVLADVIRAYRRKGVSLSDSLVEPVSDPPPGADEDRQAIRAAVARLPAHYREPFQLAHFRQVGSGEIARRLGISRNAVYIRLHRARCILRRELDDLLGP
jgi:RNA polymerase sigma-70 factor (ECF subfamily)